MSVPSSQPTSNIQIPILQFGGVTFPPQSTLKVDYVNGRKEGVGIVMSSVKTIIGRLNFHDDKLEGLNMFFDSTGIIEKECFFVNDVHNGWGCEYKNDEVVFEGVYRNGERFSELRTSATDGYLEEVKDGKTLSIFNYNNNHVVEGIGWLFEYDGDRVTAVFDCENGEKKVKRIQFDNNEMIELDDNGKVVYRGGFIGNPRDGFVRNGEGNEFDDNDSLVYCGGWYNGNREGNGLLYDNGSLKYKGEWREGKPYGNGKLYNREGKVVMERVWKNEYDDLENGIFRINSTCYVEFDKNEVFVNALRVGGLFGCSHRWKRYAYSDISEDDMNDLIRRTMKPTNTIEMVIENEDQLRELLENEDNKRNVKELVIAEGCGNEMKRNLQLYGFDNLESIVVKKNTFKNLKSLKISDNPMLNSIETENGDNKTGVFCNVNNVTITGTLMLD